MATGMKKAYKVSLNLSTGDEASFQTAGGFEYGLDAEWGFKDTWQAQPGVHGLGQCMRFFLTYLVCTQPWSTRTGDWTLNITTPPFEVRIQYHPCARPVTITTSSTDSSISLEASDRTP